MSIRKHGSGEDQQVRTEPDEQPANPITIQREAAAQRPLDSERVREIEDEG